MKVTIIVPVFNAEKYLARCLDSLLCQTHNEIEIICINDGSTDNSGVILKDYEKKDSRIKIYTQNNGGRSSARNLGLEHVRTEWFMFVDADDEIYPEAVSKLLESSSDAVSAVVSSLTVKHEVFKEKAIEDNNYYKIKEDKERTIGPCDLFSFHASVCGILFRKSRVVEFKLRFPEGLNYEDVYWHWCYFSTPSTVSFMTTPTYIYTRHNHSIMTSTFAKEEGISPDHLKIVERIFSYYKNSNIFEPSASYTRDLLETYFFLAKEHATVTDQFLIYYLIRRILREYKIIFSDRPVLLQILEVKPSLEQGTDIDKFRYLTSFLTIAEKVFPKGSKRRCILKKIVFKK